VTIAIVGKYTGLRDSYLSLYQALDHGGVGNSLRVNLNWIEAEDLEKGSYLRRLKDQDGILVPGGFGQRGVEGKIRAVKYAREKKVPFFGICLGMQCATIEFARNVARLRKANSQEFDPQSPHPIFRLWQELRPDSDLGGTMRLGAFNCQLKKGTLAYSIYQHPLVSERHRHRYEFNPDYEQVLESAGLVISGKNPEHGLVEIIELKDHPWFLGCQFHPEFKSRPLEPHCLFKSFIAAAYKHKISRR